MPSELLILLQKPCLLFAPQAHMQIRAPYCPNRVFMFSQMTLPEEGKVLLDGYDMIGYLPFGGKYDQPSVIT